MAQKRPESTTNEQPRVPRVPLRAIRMLAREIAERFRPEKIILFGSYAYGAPHADSDVDLLVIMPARNMIDQAVRIRRAAASIVPLGLDRPNARIRASRARGGRLVPP